MVVETGLKATVESLEEGRGLNFDRPSPETEILALQRRVSFLRLQRKNGWA